GVGVGVGGRGGVELTMVFPQRAAQSQNQQNENPNHQPRASNAEPRWLIPAMYLPALLLAAARVIAIVRATNGSLSGPMFSRMLEWLDRAEPVYLFVSAVSALGVLGRAFQEISSVTAQRPLR